MTLVVGVVSHTTRKAVFEEAARTLDGVDLAWVVYETEEEIHDKVAAFLATEPRLDGFISGLMPYAASQDLLPPGLPVGVVRPSALDLSLVLYRARCAGFPATPVSIDTFTDEAVDAVVTALELDPAEVVCLPFSPKQEVDEILDFHRTAYRRAGGYVISSRTAVRLQLDEDIPQLHLSPVPATIRTELHELVLRIESERASAQRFAAGVFLVAPSADEDRDRVGLMNLLLNTAEFAGAWIEDRGKRGVVVFAHKALFERITSSWVSVPALAEAARTLGVQVSAGFGVGVSARNCVLLAEQAAARAEQEPGPSGYLIEDSGLIIGPLGPAGEPLAYSYRDHGDDLESLARYVGLSSVTVSRLVAVEHELRGRPLSAAELAGQLGITDPSGRRLLRTLDAHGLVSAEGTAQHHSKGRPTRLYRLRLVNALTKGQPWS